MPDETEDIKTSSNQTEPNGTPSDQMGMSMTEDQKQNGAVPNMEKRTSLLQTPARAKVTLLCMVLTDFTAGIFFSMISPFFPVIAKEKGLNGTQIGVVFAAFEFFVIFASLLWGKLMGKIGAKFIYTTGILVCSTCAMIFGLLYYSQDGSVFLIMCIFCRSLEGLAAAAYITASYTIAAATFPDHVSTMFGLLEAANSVGFMLGPVMGGAIYQVAGYVSTMVMSGGFLFLLGLIGAIAVKPQGIKGEGKTGSILPLLLNVQSLLILVICCVSGGSLGFFDSTLSLELQKFHLQPIQLGAVFLAGPAAYALATPIWGYLADRCPHYSPTFLLIGLAVASMSFFLIGPAPFLGIPGKHLWLVIVALLVHGLMVSSIVVVFSALSKVAQSIGMPDDINTQGILTGLYNSSFSTGALVFPVIGGALYDSVGFSWAATTVAFIMLGTFILQIIQMAISRLQKKKMSNDGEARGLLTDKPAR